MENKREFSKEKTVSISKAAQAVGLPASTLRFYTQEFAAYLRVPTTAGGHRRFRPGDLEKLKYIHSLIHQEGKAIIEVKEILLSDRDPVLLRKDVNLLLEVFETLVNEHRTMNEALESLSGRITQLEDQLSQGGKKRFRWFGGGGEG